MVRTYGGNIIIDINNNDDTGNEIVYLPLIMIIIKTTNDKIKFKKYENLVLLDVRFIIDSYYSMTDIRDKIHDKEYMIDN